MLRDNTLNTLKKFEMKRYYLTILICCVLFTNCNNYKGGNKNVSITQIEWESITEQVYPKAIKLPTLCNIENMVALDSFILLENRLMEPCFVLWNCTDSEEFFSFGKEGSGPNDFLRTAMSVQGSDKNNFRIWNGNVIRKYQYKADSLTFDTQKVDWPYAGFYQRLFAINDTLYCGYKSSPHETGIHLLNINTGKSYDSISVNEGYFDNKIMPYELTFQIQQDKLVVGRIRFNQIEVYQIDREENKLSPLFTINYKAASPENPTKDGACYMKSINTDNDFFYMLNQDTEHSGKETYLDIYTWEGKPVKRLQLNDLYLDGVLFNDVLYLKKFTDDDNLYSLPLSSCGLPLN